MRRAKGVGDLARLRAGSRVEDQAHTYCLYRVGSQSMAVVCTPRKYADAVSRRQRAFDVCLTTDIAEAADRSTSIMTLPSWQPPQPEAAVPCGSEWCHSISAHRSAMSCFVASAGMALGCRQSGDTQSESGNSKYSPYIMSRCSNRIGSSAASVGASRVSNAALVLASISHCSGGSGPNIVVKVAL